MRKDVVDETFFYNLSAIMQILAFSLAITASLYAQSSISIDILSFKGLSCFMIPCLLRGGQTDQSYTS